MFNKNKDINNNNYNKKGVIKEWKSSNLLNKLFIIYLFLLIIVSSMVRFIPDIKTYLMVSISVMTFLGILLGVYAFIEKNKKNSNNNSKKKNN